MEEIFGKQDEMRGHMLEVEFLMLTASSTRGSTPYTMKICIIECKHVEDLLVLQGIFLLQHTVL
jgi:hypothetical protein